MTKINNNILRSQDIFLKQEYFAYWLALKHHITHKNKKLNFSTHQYQKALYVDKCPFIVVIKSTQCGISEWLLLRSLGKAIQGRSVFYVLPTYQLVNRFVRNRVDKTISNTLYYKNLELAAKDQDNYNRSQSMTLKDIGPGTIAYVGSNSTAGFIEFPADDVTIDELNECDQENIEMAWERLSHSEYRTEVKVSNPTVEGFGIDHEYSKTNQMIYKIKHSCGKYLSFDWFKQAVEQVNENSFRILDESWEWNSSRDINLICQHCQKPIDRYQPGVWVPMAPSIKDKHGYQISKLFAGTVPIIEMLDRFNRGLKNDTILQRFYNADLGWSFTARGAKVTYDVLLNATGDHKLFVPNYGIMGIDVGSTLNVIIGDLLPDFRIKIAYIGEVPSSLKYVNKLISDFNIRIGVIDGMPELYFVKKVKAMSKRMFSCFYRDSNKAPVDQFRNITVDRTSTLDEVKENLLLKNIILPCNSENIPNFYSQMMASTRTFDVKSNKGRGAYLWVHSKPDHYFHAMNYLLIAKKLVIAMNNKR